MAVTATLLEALKWGVGGWIREFTLNFSFNRKVKLGKKEIAALPIVRGRYKTTKQVVKESDWKTYYGSHSEVKNILKVEGESIFSRNILHICYSKKQLTYYENKYLFSLGVLENPEKYYNDNIEGRYFSKDLL